MVVAPTRTALPGGRIGDSREFALVTAGRRVAAAGVCRGKTRGQIEELLVTRFQNRTHESRSGPPSLRTRALSATRFGVHFTADVELRDLLERARVQAQSALGAKHRPSIESAATPALGVNDEEQLHQVELLPATCLIAFKSQPGVRRLGALLKQCSHHGRPPVCREFERRSMVDERRDAYRAVAHIVGSSWPCFESKRG